MIPQLRRPGREGPPAFRHAQFADAAALAELHATAFHRGWGTDEIEHLLGDAHVVSHAAMIGAALAGFILSRRALDEAEVLSIVVARHCRGRGLGRALLDRHIEDLGKCEIGRVFLEVNENNSAARALYTGADFAEIGRRPNYYGEPGQARSSALVLCRELRPGLTEDACRGF